MIYTFKGFVLANAITQSPPYPLDENSPPTKQKNVGNFSPEPSHQSDKKAAPRYAPATTAH